MLRFLRSKTEKRDPPIPERAEARLDGEAIPVAVRVSPRASRYRLVVPASGPPVLTVPPRGRWPDAQAFLDRQAGWLSTRLSRRPAATRFADGGVIALRGVPHLIVATGSVRGTVSVSEIDGEKVILLPGDPEHRARRLVDWLRVEARKDLAQRSGVHAETLGVTIKAIALRDQATRWGSCSSSGRLNYNWRLILAPPFVLDYVAAHEVAHLIEMNHSPAFWRACARAMPDMARGRTWLKAHGRELMAMGEG
jgi:predicted metal-dependent hydrolase